LNVGHTSNKATGACSECDRTVIERKIDTMQFGFMPGKELHIQSSPYNIMQDK